VSPGLLFRRFTDTNVHVYGTTSSACGKLTAKHPRIYGYLLQCLATAGETSSRRASSGVIIDTVPSGTLLPGYSVHSSSSPRAPINVRRSTVSKKRRGDDLSTSAIRCYVVSCERLGRLSFSACASADRRARPLWHDAMQWRYYYAVNARRVAASDALRLVSQTLSHCSHTARPAASSVCPSVCSSGLCWASNRVIFDSFLGQALHTRRECSEHF